MTAIWSERVRLLAGAALLVLAGCAGLEGSKDVNIGGVQTGYALAGQGRPTVVFEAGLGDGKESFASAFSELKSDTSVFAYDRPGYGGDGRFEADKDGVRTGEEVARYLHDVLRQAGVEPPYLLVGHSIGGLYVLSFARLYPGEVAGIVLVDGRPAGFTAACEASRSGLCTPPAALTALFPPHQKAEYRGVADAEAFAARPGQLGDTPVTVISAGQAPELVAARFQAIWERMQADYTEHAQNGRYVLARQNGHYVHQENTGLVVGEIRRMLAQLGGSGPATR